MRTSVVIACLIIFGFQNSVKAQSPLPLKAKPYKSEITLYSVPDHITGALLLLKDSSILVSNSLLKEDYYNGNYDVAELYIDDINVISTKRGGGGAILGGLIGLGTGFLVGRIVEGPPGPPYFNWLAGRYVTPSNVEWGWGLIGAGMGMAAGTLIGKLSIKIPLDGSMDNYNRKKKKLGRRTVKYPGAPNY